MSKKAAAAPGDQITQDFNGLPVGATSGPALAAPKGYYHFGGPSLAGQRMAVGARAVSTNGSAGTASLLNGVLSSVNAKNAQGMRAIGDKVIPGSGPVFEQIGLKVGQTSTTLLAKGAGKAGDLAVKGIKKLKFW